MKLIILLTFLFGSANKRFLNIVFIVLVREFVCSAYILNTFLRPIFDFIVTKGTKSNNYKI